MPGKSAKQDAKSRLPGRVFEISARRVAVGVLLVVASLLAGMRAHADTKPFAVGSEPSWLTTVAPAEESKEPSQQVANGRWYLLYDHQVRVEDRVQDAYSRWVQKITNESGLDAASQVDISFDPSFQTLTIHSVVVRRGSEVFDRLDRGAIRLVQRERNLDAQVYDGQVSAVLFLRDLRVGDVIDYAYTIGGSDPTLQGRYADAVVLGAPEPIARLYSRLLLPQTRHLRFARLGPPPSVGSSDPTVRIVGGESEYVWDLSDVSAVSTEPDTPRGFDPFPWAQVTEFTSWQDVASLGASLFKTPSPSSGTFRAWVNKTLANAESHDEFVLRSARFVQDEVRYVAVEVGMSRRRPNDPDTVFDRRYGDCKDKAALLVAMLDAAGIPARPALVSSGQGHALDDWAPTPTAFDHVIVKTRADSGETLWIDPTIAMQGGGIDRFKYSSLERALELDPRSTTLEKIAPEPALQASPYVRDEFRVAMPATTDETSLDSERVYRGDLADAMRASFRARTPDELRKGYLAIYQTEFPGIRDRGKLEVFDDRDRDYLRVVAHFTIPGFWTGADGSKPYTADITARAVDHVLPRHSTATRTAPLAVPYPVRARYEVVAFLPFDIRMTPQDAEADAPAFHFSYASAYGRRRLSYSYEVSTRASAMEASALQAYAGAIDKARGLLVQTITYTPLPAPIPDGPNWLFIALVAATLPVLGLGARLVYSYDPAPKAATEPDPRLAGLRGWLNVLGVTLFVRPVFVLWTAIKLAGIVFSAASWGVLVTPALPSYSPRSAALILTELVVDLAFVAYGLVLLATFLQKRRSFPVHFTVYAVGFALLSALDIACVHTQTPARDLGQVVGTLLGTLGFAGVWIAYLRTSRRAAATFVE